MVQARTTALQQSDRLLNQYRGNRKDVDQETSKLRALLHETESRCERMVGQLDALKLDNEKLRLKVDQLEKRLDEKERELDSCREVEADNQLR